MPDRIQFLAAATAALALVACHPSPCSGTSCAADGGDAGVGDGGGLAGGLTLDQLVPDHGPIDGGTLVAMSGHGFDQGLAIAFGGEPGLNVDVISATQATVVTPPGKAGGAVTVTASLGGVTVGRANAFTYDVPLPIAWCVLQYPKTLSAPPRGARSRSAPRPPVPKDPRSHARWHRGDLRAGLHRGRDHRGWGFVLGLDDPLLRLPS